MFFKDKVELLKKHAEIFKTLAGEGVSSLAATTTESLSAVAGSISEQTTTLSARTASAMNDAAATGRDVVGKVASSLSSAPDIGSACVSQLAELKLVIDSDTKDEAVSLVQKYYSQPENTDGSLVLSASADIS